MFYARDYPKLVIKYYNNTLHDDACGAAAVAAPRRSDSSDYFVGRVSERSKKFTDGLKINSPESHSYILSVRRTCGKTAILTNHAKRSAKNVLHSNLMWYSRIGTINTYYSEN